MHMFLNGLAASAGAGLTYLRNVLPELSKRPGVRLTVALPCALHPEFEKLPKVSCVVVKTSGPAGLRFWREQTRLPAAIRESKAEVLISAGNFALRRSPVPQILLSGNSLYTSKDFRADLWSRGGHGLLLDTMVKGIFAKRSVAWADCTVAPSEAFANELRNWTAGEVRNIYHGFDRKRFFSCDQGLPGEVQRQLEQSKDDLRLLFVSHYNYYRNFEMLFRAIPIIQRALGARKVKLFLTCNLASNKNPGSYRAESAAALVRELGVGDNVVELGAVPYELLHHLYEASHIYTTAAYAETFAHPLVEAMACGLPVVASDLKVHREVCGEAAIYFDRFNPADLSARVVQLAQSPETAKNLAARGLMRSRDFSWQTHVDQLLLLAAQLKTFRHSEINNDC